MTADRSYPDLAHLQKKISNGCCDREARKILNPKPLTVGVAFEEHIFPEINDHYRRGVVDRMRRFRLMEKAAEHTDEIIQLHAEVYRDQALPVEIRMDAARWLMDRAYGKAFQALDVTQLIQEQSLQKVIHEVRWLPPDPNDHSNVIEPEP
jgi:hypothetical protein